MKGFIPAYLWAAVIFGLSVMSGVNLPESLFDLFQPDKVGHLVVYGVLVFLFLRAFKISDRLTDKKVFWVVLGSALYGISLEIVQYTFFPGRFFEVLDIIANIIGSLTGWIFFKKFYK